MLHIRPLDMPHAAAVLEQLRPADADELDAAGVTKQQFLDAIPGCPGGIAWDGDTPFCVWGVREIAPGVGAPWMVATPLIARHRRAVLRLAPLFVQMMRRRFGELANVVHLHNRTAVRLIERLGFVVRREPAGPGGQFYTFTMNGDR